MWFQNRRAKFRRNERTSVNSKSISSNFTPIFPSVKNCGGTIFSRPSQIDYSTTYANVHFPSFPMLGSQIRNTPFSYANNFDTYQGDTSAACAYLSSTYCATNLHNYQGNLSYRNNKNVDQ